MKGAEVLAIALSIIAAIGLHHLVRSWNEMGGVERAILTVLLLWAAWVAFTSWGELS